MVRKFEVGGVCMAFNEVEEDPELVKVLRVSADEKTVWFRTNVKEGELVEAKLDADGDAVFFFDVPEDDKAAYENPDKPGFKDMEMAVSANASGRSEDKPIFFADEQSGFYILHPFFPSKVNEYGCGELDVHFHKKIMRTFLVFFFSVKLIVLARRVKERMFAVGGSGFVIAEESFGRANKSERIE